MITHAAPSEEIVEEGGRREDLGGGGGGDSGQAEQFLLILLKVECKPPDVLFTIKLPSCYIGCLDRRLKL